MIEQGDFMVKEDAVIVDIDGTIARKCDRGVYEHEKAADDTPIVPVISVVEALAAARNVIIYVSGRHERYRAITTAWLAKHAPYGRLWMRPDEGGNYTSDDVVKRKIYVEEIAPHYNVICVIDDRDRVVKMWRDLELTCLQAAYGDF